MSTYIDADRQSDHVRFTSVHGEVSFSIGLLPNTERLHVLKLLRDKYVRSLSESSSVALNVDQSLLIDKYERVSLMIRKTDRSVLEEHRWARLYAADNLRFGTETSKALFHDSPNDPYWFDEALFINFNMMLLPAMGSVELRPKQIRIMNEGAGSIKDPQLEIWVDDRVIVILNSNGVIEAGKPCLFMLEDSDIVELNTVLSNYQQVSLRLAFKKFNSSFRLIQLLATDEILGKLVPKETDVELLARKVGISPERLREFVERKISSERDLFNAIKTCLYKLDTL